MSRRVFILTFTVFYLGVLSGCSEKTFAGKVVRENYVEAMECKLQFVNKIADSLINNYCSDLPFTNDLAKIFLGQDSCECKYLGIIDISETEKKVLFLCDSIYRIRDGKRENYGESFLVKYNQDSVISIKKGVIFYPEIEAEK